MSKACFFTIVSNNYRHFARTLVRSVRQHSPDIDAIVVICDDPPPVADPRDDYREISIRELGLPKFDRFVFQYTILELNTAIKPWAIRALFDRGYERVVYLDPDIKLYGSIDAILARLDRADIVLTPHLTGPLDDGKHPSELAILQSGSYNLGFIALRRSEESMRFVTWWQDKLMRDCVVDIPRGLFTDQKWIDLVPGMYRGVAIERDPGWNVAYWNLNHRHVVQSDGTFSVNGRPLLFFHYSGFAPGAPLLSKHQDRFTMEGIPPAVRALANDYATDLHHGGAEECRRIAYAFGCFPNGEPIPDLARRCYREGFPWDAPHPDLWTVEGGRFLLDWLNQPAPGHRRSPWLTRLAATLYRQRPDAQAAFPDFTGTHGRSYAHWFVENAEAQAEFGEVFVAPVRAALGIGPVPKGKTRTPEPHARAHHDDPGAAMDAGGGTVAATGPRLAPARRLFQVAYRVAWGVRHAIKPLTTQSFRHRIRHSLLRKAYFDDRYQIPPLAPIAAAVTPQPAAPLRGAIPSERAGESAQRAHAGGGLAVAEGVNVVGYLAAESGVGESARSTLRILNAARIQVTPIDFRVGNMSRMSEVIPDLAMGGAIRSINLFHVNGDQMALARENLGAAFFDGRYNIGYWAWELPEFPDAWLSALDLLDEVWVPSAFCQQAIAAKSPLPVLRIPHSVEAPSVTPDRRAFDIGEGDVAFLAMCDVLSVPERKNPLGVVDAFRRAFRGGEGVRLLLKLSNLEHQPDLRSRLFRLMADDPRIKLIDGYLARQDLWTLMASIDCFVSLHRSEGFGLGMAEAMACGRTVIATGWSGNVDFTRADNALLVEYNLVELKRDLGPYRRGQVWAEPDLDSAEYCMRQIASSAELRQRLGARARQAVARELSPAAIAPMVRTRLEAIAKWR